MKTNKLLAIILSMCIFCSALPTQAFAADNKASTNQFADVNQNDWFYDSVMEATEKGLFSGTSDTTFEPDGMITRAMFVTVLGRMANIDVSKYKQKNDFDDVLTDSYYAPYVAWAYEQEITSGTAEKIFSPDLPIDRQQLAVFYIRFFEKNNIALNETVTTAPNDIDSAESWAKMSILKLWKYGIVNGDGKSFNPKENATRAEAAAIMIRINVAVKQAEEQPVEDEKNEQSAKSTGSLSSSPLGSNTSCTITFETNGGSAVDSITTKKGDKLTTLPVSYKDGCVFVGWYYDEALTKPVSQDDIYNANATLYAKFFSGGDLEHEETPKSAASVDVGTDFSIIIKSSTGMTVDGVKSGVSAENLNDKEAVDVIEVTENNSDGTEFIISGKNGYDKGASYRITLNNANLSFDGELPSVREYNFTTAMDEVLNTKLSDDVIYVPVSELTDIVNNGESVDTLSIALFSTDTNGNVSVADLSRGTFTYNGDKELKKGDIVAVYEGQRPDERTLDSTDEENGDLAYVEITNVDGAQVSFQSAEADDVIMKPDVLPLAISSDMDGNAENNSVMVLNQNINYSADIYKNMELDSQTTVDIGDFLAIYEGSLSGEDCVIINYGEITDVTENGDGTTTIAYTVVTSDYVRAAMDIYTQEQISGNEMLENVDRQGLERQVEVQAQNSGFAREASLYLASVAMATDEFTQLSEDTPLTIQEISLDNAAAPMLMSSSDTDISIDYIDADLSTDLKHFDGYSGVGLMLEIGVTLTYTNDDGDTVEIKISGAFEQEVRLNIGVSSKAVWKVWGIFPYISEYKVTANIDLFDYTGVDIQASLLSRKNDGAQKSNLSDISKQMKELLDGKTLDGTEMTIGESLAARYKALMQNDDNSLIPIIEKTIFETELRVPPALPIIAVNIGVDFVVSTDSVVSLGFDYYYMNAKRYVYTINVFEGKVSNDVINIQEETYELNFNALGKLHLRAGICAHFEIGLLSTALASVGFSAEAGAYILLHGYFSYQLKYTESQGRSEKSVGALLIEVGLYLEVSFNAQAIGGKYSTSLTIVDEEWPLWKAGSKFNVFDFTTLQKDFPKINLKQYVRHTFISDSIFEMNRQDLTSGDIGESIYDDGEDFEIEITNPAFSYDVETNMISVTPNEDDIKLTGQMIITWKNPPLSKSVEPIRRVIELYWDNLRDGYVIAPFTNGGSYIPIIVGAYESAVIVPANPTKPGYAFAGWYADENLETTYSFPETMPEDDTYIYAKWNAATDTPYKIEHYKQLIGTSRYELVKTDNKTGTTGERITAPTNSYEGYVTPAMQMLTVKADGTAVCRYYYDLKEYTVTFNPGEIGGNPEVITLKYGGKVTAPQFMAKGYKFIKWDKPVSNTIGAENFEYTAIWEADDSAQYRIEYYLELPDGMYDYKGSVEQLGKTGEVLDNDKLLISAKSSEYCKPDGAYVFAGITVDSELCDEPPVVKRDGSTVVKVYYDRMIHKVTFNPANGTDKKIRTGKYGTTFTIPVVTRAGYTFKSWGVDKVDTVFGTADIEYTAEWIYDEIVKNEYTVEYYQQSAQDTSEYLYVDGGAVSAPVGTDVEAEIKKFDNFHHNPDAKGSILSGKVKGDGSLVLRVYYDRDVYQLTYMERANYGDGTYDEKNLFYDGDKNDFVTFPYAAGQYIEDIWYPDIDSQYYWFSKKMGKDVSEADNKYGQHMQFGGWFLDPEFTTPFNGIMPAEDTTVYYKSYEYDTTPAAGTVEYMFINTTEEIYFVHSWREYGIKGGKKNIKAPNYAGYSGTSESTLEYGGEYPCVIQIIKRRIYMIWEITEADGNQVSKVAHNTFGEPIPLPEYDSNKYYFVLNSPLPPIQIADTFQAFATLVPKDFTLNFMVAGDEYASVTAPYGKEYVNFPEPTREFYKFAGWYSEKFKYEFPKKTPDKNVTFTAQWEPIKYKIKYEYMDGAKHGADCVYYYTAEHEGAEIKLDDSPTKYGYHFGGWYYDAECTNKVESFTARRTPEGYSEKTFYAKWTPNPFSVTYNDNLKSGREYDNEELFTYAAPQRLDANKFANEGYIFKGWSLSPDGKADYADCEYINYLGGNGNVKLYAIWEAIPYSISYSNVKDGAADTDNPTMYNIETDDIKLKDPTDIINGYKFLGWFDINSGKQVKVITKGSMGNVKLKAKYAHGGTFDLSYVGVNSGTATYKVTRKIPSGNVVPTTEVQNVYYRTGNGSAIGGTADAIHFKHVGGEEAFLIFTSKDGNGSSKTFTVSGENANAAYKKDGSENYTVNGFVEETANRYYKVQLYKIVSNEGGLTGLIGKGELQRNLYPNDKYRITKEQYSERLTENVADTHDNKYAANGVTTITDDTNFGVKYNVNPWSMWKDKAYAPYLSETATYLAWDTTIAEREAGDNGKQYMRFEATDNENPNVTLKATWIFEATGNGNWAWWHNCVIPTKPGQSTGTYNNEKGGVGSFRLENSYSDFEYDETNGYALKLPTGIDNVRISFAADGQGENNWNFKKLSQRAVPVDVSKPDQIGLAPLAFGRYNKGDKIFVSVVYDEIVSKAENISIADTKVAGIQINSFEYIGGAGTNVLNFKAEIGADCEISPTTNNEIITKKLTVKGSVADMFGNK